MVKPITVLCDNAGEKFLSNNKETKRSKNIDIIYHFVREHVVAGEVEIIFVKSKNNKADPLTKNLNGEEIQGHFESLGPIQD